MALKTERINIQLQGMNELIEELERQVLELRKKNKDMLAGWGETDQHVILERDETEIRLKKEGFEKEKKPRTQLRDILQVIRAKLLEKPTDFDVASLGKLTNVEINKLNDDEKRALLHYVKKAPPKGVTVGQSDGFVLLMALIGEEYDNYRSLTTRDKVLNANLTAVIDTKLAGLTSEISEKDNHIRQLDALSKTMVDYHANATKIAEIDTQGLKYVAEQRQLEEALQKAEREHETSVAQLMYTLTEYLTQRDNRLSIKLKDNVTSSDKDARTAFVNELNALLQKYRNENTIETNEEVLELIDQKGKDFPGVHLQTALNRIKLELLEAREEQEELVEADIGVILLNHPDERFATSITKLFEKIDDMKRYGTSLPANDQGMVLRLTKKLKNDVFQLVNANPLHAPTHEKFKQFEQKFTARLHTEDVAMSKHTGWGAFLKNLLAAIVTVGIALGVKLAYSKHTTGVVSFFADKTGKQSQVDTVGHALREVQESAVTEKDAKAQKKAALAKGQEPLQPVDPENDPLSSKP